MGMLDEEAEEEAEEEAANREIGAPGEQQWLGVTSAWDALKRAPTRQRLAPVACACASNPMPRTEGRRARRSVRKR
jgi:hypothetical protein